MWIASIAARTIRWPIAGRGAARGRSERAATIVEVRGARGEIGLGEAAPLPGMSIDTLGEAEAGLAGFAARAPFEISPREPGDAPSRSAERGAARVPFEILDRPAARALAAASPAARFALETALCDALARDRGASLAALLRAHIDRELAAHGDPLIAALSSATGTSARAQALASPDLGGRSAATPARREALAIAPSSGALSPARAGVLPASIAPGPHERALPSAHTGALAIVPLAAVVDDPEAARRALAAGIRCLKIKLAARDPLDRVFTIARAAPGAKLRIDGNRSWPRAEVGGRLAALAQLPIEYVEEPCRDAHRLLSAPLPVKLALDESLCELSHDDLLAAVRSRQLAAVILKPTLLGGLSAALELAALARQSGVAAIASHTLEGPIGTAACAELALALGGERLAAPAAGLAPHPALAGWVIEVGQLAADHLHPAAAAGLGFAGLDLAGALAACGACITRPQAGSP